MTTAYEQGRTAFHRNYTLNDNPFKDIPSYWQWQCGWKDARQQMSIAAAQSIASFAFIVGEVA